MGILQLGGGALEVALLGFFKVDDRPDSVEVLCVWGRLERGRQFEKKQRRKR